MPSRNIYKEYVPESYYHVYNRGVNKQKIFLDEQDYVVFLGLLKRYLGDQGLEKPRNGRHSPSYSGRIELLAFCLMPNHFHLFVYQIDEKAMRELLKSITVAYSMYFNRRHKRVGPVFQQRYRAVRILDDSHLLHISRYIHLNPDDYKTYQWSSYSYYVSSKRANWITPDRALGMFEGDYVKFVDEYKDRHDELKLLKDELADA